jgi:hypothetical protein
MLLHESPVLSGRLPEFPSSRTQMAFANKSNDDFKVPSPPCEHEGTEKRCFIRKEKAGER